MTAIRQRVFPGVRRSFLGAEEYVARMNLIRAQAALERVQIMIRSLNRIITITGPAERDGLLDDLGRLLCRGRRACALVAARRERLNIITPSSLIRSDIAAVAAIIRCRNCDHHMDIEMAEKPGRTRTYRVDATDTRRTCPRCGITLETLPLTLREVRK